MAAPYLSRVDDASSWHATDSGLRDAIYFELQPAHLEIIDQALGQAVRQGLTVDAMQRGEFPLPGLERELGQIKAELHHGRGVVILRRLPVENYSLAELELLYWGLGTHFGTGVSQSVMGDRIGHVTDVSGKDPNERAYRNSLAIPPHTDLADIVGMLSIRKAAVGGVSTYASVTAIHNHLVDTNPDYLEPLYRGYRMHRFGEQPPGEPAVTPGPVPVLSERDGFVSARIVPEYIDMAEAELGQPMPAHDRAALDRFLELAASPEFRLDLTLEPGDLSLINNYVILHSRTAFDDAGGSDARRLLFRLWLIADERRPVPRDFARAEGDGIAPQTNRASTYFSGAAAEAAHRDRSYQD